MANNLCAMLIPFRIIPETKKLKVLFIVFTNQVGFSKVSTKMNLQFVTPKLIFYIKVMFIFGT